MQDVRQKPPAAGTGAVVAGSGETYCYDMLGRLSVQCRLRIILE